MIKREPKSSETRSRVLKGLFAIFIMPIFFILACVYTFTYNGSSSSNGHAGDWKIALFFWLLFIIPIVISWRTNRRYKQRINNIISLFEGPEFRPQEGNSVTQNLEYYLGVDAIRGTILYIRMTRDGVYDVVGLDMNAGSWTRVERVGNKVKLYTKIPECPSLEITALRGETQALKIYDIICAMQHREYEYKTPFPQFVKKTADSQHLDVHLNAFI
ncbi:MULTISPECIES: plasmid IncI1-type surface exclusion protein ExcA [Rosenbergiella]|uniref:plasmid IncI1-type surface exclusion protein ExcA n=1 Tax=Rosenbergiella TaxID=1356488 RepID=UPI001F4F6FF8|nr:MULTISPECIES: plasmid IncI1-type surface exclusion protein ExcA [Rosenbergiella]